MLCCHIVSIHRGSTWYLWDDDFVIFLKNLHSLTDADDDKVVIFNELLRNIMMSVDTVRNKTNLTNNTMICRKVMIVKIITMMQ